MSGQTEITNEQLQDTENKINDFEKRVREQMEKAFWDLMREDINKTPPVFDRVIPVLEEIKEILKIIIPKNEVVKAKIDEILDISHIQMMFREGAMSFNAILELTTKIASFLKLICAPAMDNEIDRFISSIGPKFQSCSDFVEFFQWYLPLLHLYMNSIEKACRAMKIQSITDKFNQSQAQQNSST
jgi:hypothetical protein